MVRARGRAGFTLTEAVITVAIVGILSSMSSILMIQANRYFLLSKARLDLQREARGLMYVITREVRQAKNSTIVLDRAATTQPFYSRISFTTQQGASIVIWQNGVQLVMTKGVPTDKTILSKNLRYLAFTFPRSDDMSILSVSMTLETSIAQGKKKALHMASEKVQVMN